MNIHFKDKEVNDILFQNVIATYKVGSTMYGLKNDNSDLDLLCILPIPEDGMLNFFRTHHQLQYKDGENNIDYIYVFLDYFIKNMINGDSTINFEVLHYIKNNSKDPLYNLFINIFNDFYIYDILKAYLGFAKRDIKDYKNSNYELRKKKKLLHIQRGIISIEMIMENNFDLSKIKNVIGKYGNDLDGLSLLLSDLRSDANVLLEYGKMKRHLPAFIQKTLYDRFIGYTLSMGYINKKNNINSVDLMRYYYETNETGLKY